MNIYDNIERAKKYIENRKFDDALELLRKSLTVKLDSNVKDEIFFEIGKIYFIKEKYKKSIFYLNKVQREDLKQFSYDLLLQIYDKLEQYILIYVRNSNIYIYIFTFISLCNFLKMSKYMKIFPKYSL